MLGSKKKVLEVANWSITYDDGKCKIMKPKDDAKDKQRAAHTAALKAFLQSRIRHHQEAIRLDKIHLELLK